MLKYTKEDELELKRRVAITKEIHQILKKERKKQGISMAKIICNLVIEKYANVPVQKVSGK